MTGLSNSRAAAGRVPAAVSVGVERESDIAEAAADTSADAVKQRSDANRSGGLRDLWLLSKLVLIGRRGWPIVRLALAIFAVLACNMLGQVRFNRWNGAFFDAIEKRNSAPSCRSLECFSPSFRLCLFSWSPRLGFKNGSRSGFANG